MRILYTEDNPVDGAVTQRWLQRHAPHIQVDTTNTQADTLRRLDNEETSRYDLLLTDLRLPDGDGLTLLREVRKRLIPLAVVVLAGAGNELEAEDALRAGADDYLVKTGPYLEQLPATLESALQRHQNEIGLRKERSSAPRRRTDSESFPLVMGIHLDLDGRFLRVPPTLCDLLDCPEHELLTRTFQDVTLESDRDSTWNACLELLREDLRSCSLETRLVRADGQIVWCMLNCSVVMGMQDKPAFFLAYLMDISARKQTEFALLENETRTRAILRAIPDLMFVLTDDGVYLDHYARNPDDLFVPPEVFIGKNMRDIMPPDLAAQFVVCFEKVRASTEPQILEYSLQLHGEERYFEARMVNAQPGRILSIVREITDRRRAEQALSQSRDRIRQLAGRLITAHEEERVRIANELHDDLSQRLAAFAMNLSRVRERLASVPGAPTGDVALLERQAAELAERARALSHELHPAVLEHVGLTAALDSLCADFSGIKVNLQVGPLSEPIAPAVQLCLYRVAQETLHNAARHSGAAFAFVYLHQADGITELIVRDGGRGFDQEHARQKGGLGLISLQERVHVIGGTLQIVSVAGKGTEVRVRAPAVT